MADMTQTAGATLPKLGAALRTRDLEGNNELRAFLFDEVRDIEVQDFINPKTIRDGWMEAADKAKTLLDGHQGRLGIHGPFIGFNIDVEEPEIRAIAQQRLLNGVMATARLAGPERAPHMVVHSPFTTWNWYNLDTSRNRRQEKLESIRATLGPAIERARSEGVAIVIENVEDMAPDDRRDVADAIAPDVLSVSIDTGHAHYAHRATGAPPVDVFIRRAGARLGHIHLQDGDGYADRHWRIGEGDIAWAEVFRAIGDTGVSPRLILEMKRASDILPSATWLREREFAV